MKNDGVQTHYYGGIRNRRKRALERNERQLRVTLANLDDVKKKMALAEQNPKLYDKENYKHLISHGDIYTNMKNRLEKEIETLKTRV